MPVADIARPSCVEREGLCQKCQIASRETAARSSYFLLAAQHPHARESLAKSLRETETEFEDWGVALALPQREAHLSNPLIGLLQRLPESARQDTKGSFYSGGGQMDADLLKACLQAEPLAALLARAEHEWVRVALTEDWLFCVFHPIVQAASGEVFGHEALIRARHPQSGATLGAGQIIVASVAMSMEHVLDQQARKTAIRQAAALSSMEGKLFINFMPNTIYDPEVCLRTTMEAAQENGMALSRLVFEVVETEHIPDMRRLKKILDYYRSRGVGTAVDDMGAGYSSLAYLTALEPDFVKLDRDLVVRAETDKAARNNMDLIVAQAKALKITVIAEGIETEAQLRLCQEAGADLLQGYLFGRPANPPTVSRSAFDRQLTPA